MNNQDQEKDLIWMCYSERHRFKMFQSDENFKEFGFLVDIKNFDNYLVPYCSFICFLRDQKQKCNTSYDLQVIQIIKKWKAYRIKDHPLLYARYKKMALNNNFWKFPVQIEITEMAPEWTEYKAKA